MIRPVTDQSQPKPRCLPYLRVSSDPQAESGVGIAGQDLRAREYFERKLAPLGVKWLPPYIDLAQSAFKKPFKRRPAAARLLSDVQPGDHILIPSLDRGFRNTVDFLSCYDEWDKRGYLIHIPDAGVDTSNPESADMARAFAGMRAIFAELESRFKRRRTLDAHAALKAQGRPWGQAPVGYMIVGRGSKKRLVPDHEQRSVMMEIVKHHLNGMTFGRIATLLTKNNVYWKKRDRRANLGYQLQPWDYHRCERGYHSMLTILAEESRQAEKQNERGPKGEPADSTMQPPQPSSTAVD